MRYRSTKTFTHSQGLSAAFRQWRADSHCKYLHGYALQIKITFEASCLDVRNWVVDFGSLKPFKALLENTFDHKTLVAGDDPEMHVFRNMEDAGLVQLVEVEATGCEAFAKLIYDSCEVWLGDAGYKPRVWVHSVEVREHDANSAIYYGVHHDG